MMIGVDFQPEMMSATIAADDRELAPMFDQMLIPA